MEAHLATRGHHSLSHEDRYLKMSWVGVPNDVYTRHEQLQQWSQQARYLMRRFPIEVFEGPVLSYLSVVTNFVGLEPPSAPSPAEPSSSSSG